MISALITVIKKGSTMTIRINTHELETGDSFTTEMQGRAVVSDTDESGTSVVKNIVVLSQASYDALGTKDSGTLYFIT